MPTIIELDVHELDDFIKKVNQSSDTVVKISINEGLRKIGHLIVPAAGTGPMADETPRGPTGKLARSTVFQILGGPEDQRLEVRQAAKSPLGVFYGFIVREGRGPVFAVRAKALHFWIGGKELFRKSVGPAAPNPYHIRVLSALMPAIQDVVNEMGEKLAIYISGNAK